MIQLDEAIARVPHMHGNVILHGLSESDRITANCARCALDRAKADVQSLVGALRGIHALAEFDIETGLTQKESAVYQIEADARAALARFAETKKEDADADTRRT